MNLPPWLPVAVVASSLVARNRDLLPEMRDHRGWRTFLNLAGALLKLVFVALMLWGVSREQAFEARYALLPGLDFELHADALSLLFVTLSAVLWLSDYRLRDRILWKALPTEAASSASLACA